jgi:repressor LexA
VSALTRRQGEIYRCLRSYLETHAEPPTLNELCGVLGLSSRGSLHKHIQALVVAGLVAPLEGRQRGIRLIEAAAGGGHELPLLGYIAAGRPIEAVAQGQTMSVPDWLRGRGDCYVLQVRGDSMIEAGILDRDWVIVEHRSHARNGEIVVALVDGEEVTLKRIHQSTGRVTLEPANAGMVPLAYDPDRVQIQGVLVGQMRRYG